MNVPVYFSMVKSFFFWRVSSTYCLSGMLSSLCKERFSVLMVKSSLFLKSLSTHLGYFLHFSGDVFLFSDEISFIFEELFLRSGIFSSLFFQRRFFHLCVVSSSLFFPTDSRYLPKSVDFAIRLVIAWGTSFFIVFQNFLKSQAYPYSQW